MLEIFVYGTLKRGMVNHRAMQGVGMDQARFAVLRGVQLMEIPPGLRRSSGQLGSEAGNAYPYPALLRGRGTVVGETHRLGRTELAPDDALRVLDHLEREGYEYHRVKWWAIRRGERVRVWVYVYASKGLAARTGARTFGRVVWQPSRGTISRVQSTNRNHRSSL